jgi:hypothetical protein
MFEPGSDEFERVEQLVDMLNTPERAVSLDKTTFYDWGRIQGFNIGIRIAPGEVAGTVVVAACPREVFDGRNVRLRNPERPRTQIWGESGRVPVQQMVGVPDSDFAQTTFRGIPEGARAIIFISFFDKMDRVESHEIE